MKQVPHVLSIHIVFYTGMFFLMFDYSIHPYPRYYLVNCPLYYWGWHPVVDLTMFSK